METLSWWALADEQFVISILTIIYYCWILLLMLTSASTAFRSAFYRIFIVTGLFDIQSIMTLEWVRTDHRFGLGPDYEIISRILYSLSFTYFFIHIFGSFLMTLNRYIGVCHPIHYYNCCTLRVAHTILLVVVFLAFVVHTKLFFIEMNYQWENNKWIYAGRVKPIPYFRVICVSVVIFHELASIILTVLILYSLTMSRRHMDSQNFRQGVGLLIAVIIESIVGAGLCIYQSILTADAHNTNLFLNWIERNFSIILFVVFAMNSYVILFMSSDLREEVIRFCQRMFKILQFCGIKKPDKRITPSSINF